MSGDWGEPCMDECMYQDSGVLSSDTTVNENFVLFFHQYTVDCFLF